MAIPLWDSSSTYRGNFFFKPPLVSAHEWQCPLDAWNFSSLNSPAVWVSFPILSAVKIHWLLVILHPNRPSIHPVSQSVNKPRMTTLCPTVTFDFLPPPLPIGEWNSISSFGRSSWQGVWWLLMTPPMEQTGCGEEDVSRDVYGIFDRWKSYWKISFRGRKREILLGLEKVKETFQFRPWRGQSDEANNRIWKRRKRWRYSL